MKVMGPVHSVGTKSFLTLHIVRRDTGRRHVDFNQLIVVTARRTATGSVNKTIPCGKKYGLQSWTAGNR
jgi:hypothetical protein